MINSRDFSAEMVKLLKHFSKDLDLDQLADFQEILSDELDTAEFFAACRNAKKQLQPHPSFFPSPQWLIDSVLGTLEQRAVIQFQNLDRLSAVGRQALEATGGIWTIRSSERPEAIKREFIANFLALAKNASPEALRMPENALPALNPIPPQQPTPDRPPHVTLADKVGILRCRCNFESQRQQAWAEARRYGFTVNMSPRCPENQRITLSSGQDPNEIIQESIEDLEASVRSLTGSLYKPLGF
jgi:hypothetical protein